METGDKEWLKISEAAELVGLPGTRAYGLPQRGESPAVRIDVRRIWVHKGQLEKFDRRSDKERSEERASQGIRS